MIDTLEDVVKAESEIISGGKIPNPLSPKLRPGFCGAGHGGHCGAVQAIQPHKNIRDGSLQAGESYFASFQASVTDGYDPAEDLGVREHPHRRFNRILPVVRQNQTGRMGPAIIDRRPPGHLVTVF